MANLIVAVTLLGLGGCSASSDGRVSTTPDEIMACLREYNDRIEALQATANDGLLHALASESPEMAAQAAVSFGKSRKVNPAVKQQLEAMANSGRSQLSQIAALQALSRLDLLTPESQAMIDRLAADEVWADIADYINR